MFLAYGGPIIVAITFHEAAHGYVAWKLGDSTAWMLGRVTFNPLKHIDPIGTVLLPGILIISGAPFVFGYAKPVPVNFSNLNNPRKDMIIVAGAGPMTNIVLALASAILLKIGFGIFGPTEWLFTPLWFSVQLNVILAVFNMLPLPPLDGGRVAVGLLPRSLALPLARLEPYGFFILIGLIFLLPLVLAQMGIRFNPLAMILLPPVKLIVGWIIWLVGL